MCPDHRFAKQGYPNNVYLPLFLPGNAQRLRLTYMHPCLGDLDDVHEYEGIDREEAVRRSLGNSRRCSVDWVDVEVMLKNRSACSNIRAGIRIR